MRGKGENVGQKTRGRVAGLWWSKPVGVGAAVVVGVAVLGTGYMVVNVLTDDNEPGRPVASASPTAEAWDSKPAESGEKEVQDAGRGCDVPVGDASRNPLPPKDLRWEAAAGQTWPVSDTVGPTKRAKGDVGVCFARSPMGAALAAASMGYAGLNGASIDEIADAYLVDSPGRDAAIAAAAESDGLPSLPEGMTLAGYDVLSYTDDDAQVQLVLTAPGTTTGYAGGVFTLRWVDGDWKEILLDDGSPMSGISFPTYDEFTMWADR